MKRILITGAAGRVGKDVYLGLRDDPRYEVIATDINPDEALGITTLDVTDYDSCHRMMAGVDTVIHMAYLVKHPKFAESLQVNYLGVANIYEAAVACGVRRVIFGSSNHTVGHYLVEEKVDVHSAYRPSNLYGLAKSHGEILGRLYSDKHGISSFNVRIGTYFGVIPRTKRHQRTWISTRDLIHLIACCIEADDDLKYLTLFGISNNRDKYWDIDYLADLIGYRPQDDGSAYEDQLEENGNEDELVYQGGINAFRRSV